MDLRSIENKKLTGDRLRMTDPNVVFSDDTRILDYHEVNESEVCRIDLISLKYYKSADYVDYILKYNNISNPFSITVGDTLIIPENDAVLVSLTSIKQIDAVDDKLSIRDQFVNTKRLSVKDAKRSEYLAKKAKQKANGSKQILPPNILKDGDSNIKIENGAITIGTPSINQ